MMREGPDETSDARRSTILRARRVALWALVIAALAVHGLLWSISRGPLPESLWGDEIYYWQGATQLHAGAAWHSDPLWPPLYPRFLAGILAAGGSVAAVRVVQTLMLLAVAWLLRDLARHLTGSRFAGDVAGALTLVYPPLAAFAHYLWPEVLHMLLFTGALWILVRRPRPLWLLGAGALLGLALLSKSLLGPFLPLLLLALAAGDPPRTNLSRQLGARALRVFLVVVAICAVVAPTAISNHRRATGVVISDSLAFNLWVGLNERSRKNFVDRVVDGEWRTFKASAATFPERNAILRDKTRALVGEHGVLAVLRGQLSRQYFRFFDRGSFLTDMLPGGDIAAYGWGYLDPPAAIAGGLRGFSYALYAVILLGATAGLVVCPPRGNRWLLLALLFIAYNLALFLLLHVKSRYRVPLLPFLFLYSGCAAAWLAHKLGLNPGEAELWGGPTDRRSWWAAGTAALVLLFLAFGRDLV